MTTVLADPSLAEGGVLGGHFLHLGDDLGAVVSLSSINGLEKMQHAAVISGMVHGRILLAVDALDETLGPGSGIVVHVPIEGFSEL